ncbi:autophagy-related protein 2 homolog A isoform X2 [Drosophila grimshawi]|uniref:autophagy-related protein 2 homolog A isoform X2 n=1 Tax=Drosophila grimshawi TaxID=7222 RepID=UPI000C86F320|nr:autophagy-related protein 2 homolog A isoform X2 [Drosophila grimshawi]
MMIRQTFSHKTDFFLPGDTDEINEFCEGCKDSSNLKILVSIPKVKIVLESKDLYEIIYNRLNWNLLMWEPQSATSQEENSVCSFELCVKEGILLMYTDIRDLENKEQTSSRGKLKCNIKEFRLFSVTGLKNEKNLSYFCTQLKEIDVYHCGNILSESANAWSDATDTNLKRIICNLPNEQRVTNNREEMVSVVAELKKQPDKRLKRIKLAFGINGVNVWHKPEYSVNHWIYQLIDFLNVTDFPIEAYEPYALVSEIQGHIWNFAMEYRPKYLAYRALLDIGYCSFSSNIIYPITGCTLRMITEDCILSIGPTVQGGNVIDEQLAHINCSGLVPVLSVGLINFSIHLNDQSKLYPNIDLRSSIHDMHLKTCFDAADALAQLIAYIANDKDLMSKEKNSVGPEKPDDCPLNRNDQNNDDTLKHINILMADAVKDVKETSPSDLSTKMNVIQKNETEIQQNTSLFKNSFDACNISDFESNVMLESCYQHEKNALPQVEADLGATLFTTAQVLEERDFHVIHDEEIFFMDKFGVEQIYVSEDPLQIVDNHFCLPSEKVDVLRPPVHFPIPEQSYTLCEMTFTWHLFGGKDFPDLTGSPTKKDKSSFTTGIGMSETYKHGVSQAPRKKHTKLKKAASDELNTSRNSDVLVEIQFSKIRLSHDAYPKQSVYASRQVLVISDIEIRDRLLTSDINKLLYHSNKNSLPQRNDGNMITVKALNVRSNVKKNRAEECSLKVSILPIRLNIDQDTLLFLEEFFSALVKGSSTGDNVDNVANYDDPMMAVNEISNALHNFKLNEKKELDSDEGSKTFEFAEDCSPNDVHPTYFKEFVFSPALPICFDYHGRRVELSRGPITGLVMGLAQLQGSGICLREVINRRGLLGWNKLFEFVCKEWLKDIKRNQLPNILSGIGPTNAVLQLFQGFFDLFRLPLQQYNKDGRIIRGFQLGAQSFSARTAFAALEITSRIIHLLQFTAETTFDMLSAGPSLSRRRNPKHGKRRQGRPKDLREGVANAYTIVKEGINESANTLLEAACVEHDQKGYSGAVGAVVRQLPQLVVCPAVLATQATTNILGGAKSSLVPEAKREATDKWKNAKN